MKSKFRALMTQKAKSDLEGIVDYMTKELSNPQAASNFLDEMQKAMDELCAFPESGAPVVNDFLPTADMRKRMIGNYVVFYIPDFEERAVRIIRIVYSRRNMEEILRKLGIG